jgi:hypothetical protein
MSQSILSAAPHGADRREGDDHELPRMSPIQVAGTITIAFVLFLFVSGPIWRHPWDFDRFNRAVFWSYAAIPLLVFAALLWSKRLTARAFFLDALTITLVKYAFTFMLALVLWEALPMPAAAPLLPHRSTNAGGPAKIEPTIIPTWVDARKTGSVAGSVTDAGGLPVANALVFVSAGLDDHVFAPPARPLELSNPGTGVVPSIAVAQAGQTILARSTDGHLHSLVATQAAGTIFNTPLLGTGEPSDLRFREAAGVVTLHCNVHQGAEREGYLLVLAHPFFTWTDDEGRFRIEGVPSGHLRVAALDDGRSARDVEIDLAPGGEGDAKLVIGASPSALIR